MDWWLGSSVNNGEALSSRNTQKKNFLSLQRESSQWPSRYRLDALITELWKTRGEQGHILGSYMCDMCPAQWLEHPTGIWKVMGLTPVGGSENSFSEYFDLRTLLHCLYFIQVTNPFIKARFILWCLLLKCKLFEVQMDSTSQTDGATFIWFTVVMQVQKFNNTAVKYFVFFRAISRMTYVL